MLALLRVAVGGCAPPIPCVARQGEGTFRSGRESRPIDRTGKREWRWRIPHRDVSLWVEGDDRDRRPVAGRSAPAPGIALPRPLIQGMARREHGSILAGMALGWGDVADAAVPVLVVEPVHELHRPVSRRLQVGKPLAREFGPVFGGAEQRLGERVVVAQPWQTCALRRATPNARPYRRSGLVQYALIAPPSSRSAVPCLRSRRRLHYQRKPTGTATSN